MANVMKSPFPGMDPYLEQHWGDVHASLMVYMRDQINYQLPGDLQARVEEAIMVDMDETSRTVFPDVRVVEQPEVPSASEPLGSGSIAVAEPCIIPLPDERPTMRHIEIVDPNSGNRVVTAIELLSPANKVGEAARRNYREKQREYLQGGVNLVEIDLIREGAFIVAVPERLIPIDHRTPYIICIRRAIRPAEAEVIRVPLRHPLPNIRIPLRPTDADIVLELQPLLNQCYDRGRYWMIDYSKPPLPLLGTEDQRWADQLLAKKRA
jgi:hypothetical protein